MKTLLERLLRKIIPTKREKEAPRSMRETLLDTTLRIGLVVGSTLFVLFIFQDIKKGLYGALAITGILYAWLLVITIVHRIRYRVRVISWLSILFLSSMAILILNGFTPELGMFLVLFISMTTLFFGFEKGLLAILWCSLAILVMGFFTVRGKILPIAILQPSEPLFWIIGLLSFIIMSFLLILSTTTVIANVRKTRLQVSQKTKDLAHAMEQLSRSEDHFRSMIENSTDIIAIIEADGTFNYLSPSIHKVVNYHPEEMVGKNVADYIQPDDLYIISDYLTSSSWPEEIKSAEIRARHADGSWRSLEVRGKKITSSEQKNQLILNCRDITDQKQAAQALLAADELKQKVFSNLNDAVMVLDANTNKVIDCNQAASKIFGYAREEIIGQTTDFLHASDAALEDFRQHLNSELKLNGLLSHYEIQMKQKNGTIFPADHSLIPMVNAEGIRTGWIGIVQDISARKLAEKIPLWELEQQKLQAETALHVSETRFRSLFSGMMDAYFSTDMAGTIQDFNEVFSNMLGYEPVELVGKKRISLLAENWHSYDSKVISEEVLAWGYSDVHEKEMVRKNGEVFPVELRTFTYRDESGNRAGMWSIVRDISERKKIEQKLYRSEEQYRTLAEAAPDMIFIIDTDDRIQYVNSFAASSYGTTPDAMINQPRSKFFGSPDGKNQLESLKKVYQTGQPVYSETKTRFPKEPIWLSTWLVPFKNGSDEISGVLGVSRNISERKIIEEKLLSAQQNLEEKVQKRTRELMRSQDQLRSLSRKIITAQEDERRFISRELHDEAGQTLMSLKLSLDSLQNDLNSDQVPVQVKLTKVIADIDQLMVQIRELSHRLRPPLLDLGGINLSLKELCWDFKQLTDLSINYEGVEIPNLPDEITISIYRMVQEALVNVQKHSKATEVKVSLLSHDGVISLTIQDNGMGIPRNVKQGIGLLGIEERLNLLGGRLVTTSKPGKGLTLEATIPWSVMTTAPENL